VSLDDYRAILHSLPKHDTLDQHKEHNLEAHFFRHKQNRRAGAHSAFLKTLIIHSDETQREKDTRGVLPIRKPPTRAIQLG
jgi:hypothetical protein